MVNRHGGTTIHDLAYYWPQYTPITTPADYDITLFAVSKITGHARTRIGENLSRKPQAEISRNSQRVASAPYHVFAIFGAGASMLQYSLVGIVVPDLPSCMNSLVYPNLSPLQRDLSLSHLFHNPISFQMDSGRDGKGRWVHLFLISLSLNMLLLSCLFYDKGRSAFQKEETLNGVCFETNTKNECEMGLKGEEDEKKTQLHKDSVINLEQGDPTMFESFWRRVGDKSSIVISGWQKMSYYSDTREICWFLEQELAEEIKKMHQLVGNAVTENRYIVVGTGSTQLFQAALYALSPSEASEPLNVVAAIPYYSTYEAVTDFLKSGLYRWAGDANAYDRDSPYIELVTSPNNPDGYIREAVVNRPRGKTIHDLAYYWPQYTPITTPADYDITLFTVSKCSGHAGTRIGWGLVKDLDVAKKMTQFIMLNTIGVSKDSQLRAAKILRAMRDAYEGEGSGKGEKFFEYGRRLMNERWERLRNAVQNKTLFSLPEFPMSFCTFTGETTTVHPAFAWLKCEREMNCESFLKRHNILGRSGRRFGVHPQYVKISMLDRDETFDLLIERLSEMPYA